MPIEFRCPGCTRILRTPDESAGKKARCPECGAIVDIPIQSESIVGSDPMANPNAEPSFVPPAETSRPSPPKSSVNPYSAPAMGDEPEIAEHEPPKLAPLQHCHETLDNLLRLPWELLKYQFWMAVVMGLVALGLAGLSGLPGQILAMVGGVTRNLPLQLGGMALAQVINIFVQTWIQLGLTKATLRWARTGDLQVADLFSVSRYYWRGLALMALMVAVFLGIFVLCAIPVFISIPFQNGPITIIFGVLGFLVYFSFATLIGLSMFLAFPLMVDRQLGIVESLRISNQFMSGNRLNVLLMGLVLAAMILAGTFCTCFVGIIVAPAVQTLFSVVAYLRITGQPVFQPPPRVAAKEPRQNNLPN